MKKGAALVLGARGRGRTSAIYQAKSMLLCPVARENGANGINGLPSGCPTIFYERRLDIVGSRPHIDCIDKGQRAPPDRRHDMAKTIKVTIPAQTVEIDVEAWANEFGVSPQDVRDDVKAYFRTWCEEQVAVLGLGKK